MINIPLGIVCLIGSILLHEHTIIAWTLAILSLLLIGIGIFIYDGEWFD